MKLAAFTAALFMMTAAPALAQNAPAAPASPASPAAAPAATADAAPAGKFTLDTPVETIAADPAGKAVLAADFPEMLSHPAYDQFKALSLNALQPLAQGAITDAMMAKAKAESDSADLVTRRRKMAEDKIAAAERTAIAEVRATAADPATRAPAALIAEKHDATADRPLIDHTIAGLGRLN